MEECPALLSCDFLWRVIVYPNEHPHCRLYVPIRYLWKIHSQALWRSEIHVHSRNHAVLYWTRGAGVNIASVAVFGGDTILLVVCSVSCGWAIRTWCLMVGSFVVHGCQTLPKWRISELELLQTHTNTNHYAETHERAPYPSLLQTCMWVLFCKTILTFHPLLSLSFRNVQAARCRWSRTGSLPMLLRSPSEWQACLKAARYSQHWCYTLTIMFRSQK